MAASYETVLKGKYPAKAHAKRVVEYIRSKSSGDVSTGILYLESRATKLLEDNDEPEPFRQRRFFYYMTGCPLADCHFTYDISTDVSTLFIPPIDADSVIWSGLPTSIEEAKALYDVDEVKYADAINPELVSLAGATPKPSTVYAIANQVSHHVTFVQFDKKNLTLLKEAIERCRVVKDEYEIALMRKANDISGDAHRAVLAHLGKAKTESELEAVFLAKCVAAGAKNQAYHSIVASGRAAATLHYVKNDQPMEGKLNLLLDGACEWNCYAADITRTFPLTGKFTKESRAIYDIVLEMQEKCLAAIKAGVLWEDVHTIAHKVAIDGLLKIGILKGDAKEILDNRTSVAFFPHGLGHYLGMDTHDTGGDANYEDKDTMFRYLRVRGTLPAGSVITVEPGVYFCNFIIEPYLKDEKHAKYIDSKVLEKYWDVGGVRIEDDVVVTESGIDNLTTTVKDPEEIERLIAAAS
jgi:Xaa-Pro dipeptidase